MDKKPAFQFYVGDWLKDPELRMCSPAARGIWIDMLCLMHELPQRGVFRTKNCSKMVPVSIKKISKGILGCKPKMIQELVDNGVVKIARKDGALYCKRMVLDELHRRHKAINGKKGGSKTQANPKQNPSKPESKPQANPGSSNSNSNSSLDISTKRPLRKLALEDQKKAIQLTEKLERVFEYQDKRERTTFRNIVRHLLENGMIDQGEVWLMEVLQWGSDNDKPQLDMKKCFNSKVQKLAGFKKKAE